MEKGVVVRTEELAAGYANVPVVTGLDIEVASGEVVALLGRNGAGKTTVLQTIAGLIPVISGQVELHDKKAVGALHRRVRDGLAFVSEERAVIRRLTVAENLRVARCSSDIAFEIFPELARLRHRHAGLLSGGEQQMLALGKVMAKDPVILLIDELSLGLGPIVVNRLLQAVRQAAEAGAGVLLVEQQARTALSIADRAYILSGGSIRLTGSGEEMLGRVDEIEAMYLAA